MKDARYDEDDKIRILRPRRSTARDRAVLVVIIAAIIGGSYMFVERDQTRRAARQAGEATQARP